MHKDTEQDYRHLLKNMTISNRDIRSEYMLAHVLMAGQAQQIREVLDTMEADDFYDLGVQVIYNTALEESDNICSGEEQFMNIHTKHLDRFTGKNFHFNIENKLYSSLLNFYMTAAPDDKQMRACMKVVKSKRAMRDMIHSLYTAVDMCTHEDDGVSKATQYIGDVAEQMKVNAGMSETIISKIDFSEQMIMLAHECNDTEKRKQRTINMPWPNFQNAVGGFHAGELVIVSAKSGNGKSAFSFNIGIEAGVTQKIPTLYINSEMGIEQLEARYLSYMCKIDSRKYLEGGYRDESADDKYYKPVMDSIIWAANKYQEGKLLFATIPDLQLANIEKIIRQDCAERQTRLVIVDYLGRMDITKVGGVRDLQEWQILRLAANRLKTMAQKYNVCIIMVAQLTDEGTLQGAKSMKNEADMWLSINRLKQPEDSYCGKHLIDIFPFNTFVTVEKARSVKDATKIAFRFEGATMSFYDTKTGIKAMIDKNKEYEKYANELMTKEEYKTLTNMLVFSK